MTGAVVTPRKVLNPICGLNCVEQYLVQPNTNKITSSIAARGTLKRQLESVLRFSDYRLYTLKQV